MGEKENLPVWDGRKSGHYEVWYITGNHKKSGSGFWIRYTLEIPYKGDGWAGIWFSFFEKGKKPFGLVEKYSLSEFKSEKESFLINIAGSTLSNNESKGEVSSRRHKATWDLTFESSGSNETYYHLPRFLYRLPTDTHVLSPNISVALKGNIKISTVDRERVFEFNGDPADQTHLWGRKHAHSWVWAHCNGFENKGDFFEGLAVVVKRGFLKLPLITIFSLRIDEKRYDFNNIFSIVKNKSKYLFSNEPLWEGEGVSGRIKANFKIHAARKDFILAEYEDPDGEVAFCHNTEIAWGEITLYKDGKMFKKIESDLFHIEFGARSILDENSERFNFIDKRR